MDEVALWLPKAYQLRFAATFERQCPLCGSSLRQLNTI